MLHLFSGYGSLSTAAHLRGWEVVSLDYSNDSLLPGSHFKIDFLEFNYKQFEPGHFDFVFVGFPCNTFSKAAGNYHFVNNVPVSAAAHISLKMITQLYQLLDYFECDYMIENPTSALFSNPYFLKLFPLRSHNIIRVFQKNYGHVLNKQTDLYTTVNNLWLDNPIYRVNGRYGTVKMDNLPLRTRQSYPINFCNAILDYIENK